jgi:hypothetical protein
MANEPVLWVSVFNQALGAAPGLWSCPQGRFDSSKHDTPWIPLAPGQVDFDVDF